MLIRRWLPGDGSDTIEAQQPEFRAQPEIAVGRLGDGPNGAFGKSIADFPWRVRVLADVQRRIQRERAREPRQQDAGRCDNVRSSLTRSVHDDPTIILHSMSSPSNPNEVPLNPPLRGCVLEVSALF